MIKLKSKSDGLAETTKQEPTKKKSILPLIFGTIAATITFLFTAGIYGWINITVENSSVILFLVFSIMINVLVLGTVFVLPIGKKVLNRFKQLMLYKKGNHINALYITKNGVIKEVFQKRNDDGTIKINKQSYTRNPTLLFNYEGIPTYVFIEDHADAMNVWQDKYAAEMSCSEIDEVMNSTGAFDLKQWLEQNKMVLFIALMVMVGCCVGAIYFGYMSYEMLRDGTYTAVKGAVKVAAGV